MAARAPHLNVMRLRLLLCFLLLVPALAEADHACDDGYPMGKPVKLAQPLPAVWFRIGSEDVREKATHSALKQRHRKEYFSGYDEGPVGSAMEFLTFVRKQDKGVQDNGAWIVTTHPDAYSGPEKDVLEDIKTLCRKQNIPLFIVRGSELPNGWKRYDNTP